MSAQDHPFPHTPRSVYSSFKDRDARPHSTHHIPGAHRLHSLLDVAVPALDSYHCVGQSFHTLHDRAFRAVENCVCILTPLSPLLPSRGHFLHTWRERVVCGTSSKVPARQSSFAVIAMQLVWPGKEGAREIVSIYLTPYKLYRGMIQAKV